MQYQLLYPVAPHEELELFLTACMDDRSPFEMSIPIITIIHRASDYRML